MKVRVLLISLALSAPAFAYIDPVTGNIIVQAMLLMFASVALGFNRLKLWVQKLLGKVPPSSQETKSLESEAQETAKASAAHTSEAEQLSS